MSETEFVSSQAVSQADNITEVLPMLIFGVVQSECEHPWQQKQRARMDSGDPVSYCGRCGHILYA